jgi:predicted  nucleic acid-binding Zn-ribbon protein
MIQKAKEAEQAMLAQQKQLDDVQKQVKAAQAELKKVEEEIARKRESGGSNGQN